MDYYGQTKVRDFCLSFHNVICRPLPYGVTVSLQNLSSGAYIEFVQGGGGLTFFGRSRGVEGSASVVC